MLQCPQCPRSAPSPQLLLAHLSHAHQLAFLCYLCLQPFSTLKQLVSSSSSHGRDQRNSDIWFVSGESRDPQAPVPCAHLQQLHRSHSPCPHVSMCPCVHVSMSPCVPMCPCIPRPRQCDVPAQVEPPLARGGAGAPPPQPAAPSQVPGYLQYLLSILSTLHI